jgi:hypothetical protein
MGVWGLIASSYIVYGHATSGCIDILNLHLSPEGRWKLLFFTLGMYPGTYSSEFYTF